MNAKSLLNLIHNSEKLNNSSLIELKNIIDKYPYFAGGQLLYLLNLKKLNDGRYQQKLPNTSIRIPNRSRLKSWIEFISKNNNPLEASAQESKDETTLGNFFDKQDIFSLLPSSSLEPQKTVIENKITSNSKIAKNDLKENESNVLAPKKPTSAKSKSSTTKKNVESSEKNVSANKQDDLINRFLQKKETAIKPRKEEDYFYDNSDNSLTENLENSSETLAQLYLSQGLFSKAIEVYEYLSLKYPEKSRFFAKEIKKAKNNNKQK